MLILFNQYINYNFLYSQAENPPKTKVPDIVFFALDSERYGIRQLVSAQLGVPTVEEF